MGTYNLSLLTKKLLDSEFNLVSLETLKNILEIENERSFYRVVGEFVKNGILTNFERNKYLIEGKNADTFEVANFLYQPSYISLETALNYWGVLSQFPFEVTSVTSKKTVNKTFGEKIYGYRHMDKKYFGMFIKKNKALIALPEKALFDQFYLVSKGIKTVNFDEYDFGNINKKEFLRLCSQLNASKKIISLSKKFVK